MPGSNDQAPNVSHITGMINGIEQLNGNNFVSWKEKLEMTLALLNVDYALLNDPPEAPNEGVENYEALKKDYDNEKAKWDDSNRKCLMMIKGSITQSMRRTRGSIETVGMYAVQCCKCHKWRTVPTKDEFETLRENFTDDPWFCSKRPDCSCEDPADIEYDSSRIWVIDKPNIPKPPPKTERLVIMRSDLTKTDVYYTLPNGKRARTMGEVQKFLDTNPEYKDSLSTESFSFTAPKIAEETVSDSSVWKAKKAKKQHKTISSSSKN